MKKSRRSFLLGSAASLSLFAHKTARATNGKVALGSTQSENSKTAFSEYFNSIQEQLDLKLNFIGGNFTTDLPFNQATKVSAGPNRFSDKDAKLSIINSFTGSDIHPTVHVCAKIDDDSGDTYAGKVAGIYSYIEQTGSNTNQYVKSLCGVSVNAAIGNNDSTGVAGYSYKLQATGGIGDVCGAGGASWQYSTEEGLCLGGEFSAHQNVAGTFASDFAKSGNNTMSLHLTTNSIGSRCFAGLCMDTFGMNAGTYGFWNAIMIQKSCFAANGESETGTVGINFGNNTDVYPDMAIKLGNANHHFYRGNASIRTNCSALDIENDHGGAVGVRLVTPEDDQQNAYFGAYTGSVGADGETILTPIGNFTIDSVGYAYMTSVRGDTSTYSRAGCSSASDAFIPMSSDGSGSMACGWSSRLWSQVYAASTTISTSDATLKTLRDGSTAVGDNYGVSQLTSDELAAFLEIGREIGVYKFKDAVAAKGADAARLHSGLTVQKAIAILESYDLDPMFLCSTLL